MRGRPGSPARACRLGVEHGGYGIGCCSGLMPALFALGVMSLFRAAVVAAAILVEMPGGVPGLTQADRAAPGMSMH